MPPIAKNFRIEITETDDKPNKTKTKKPKKTVVSGQLEKAILNKRKSKKPKGEFKSSRGVVFIKNLPKEFQEEQIHKYFKQFGHVTRVRVARSRKTGGSRGFAYVEFQLPEVAEIAAETMNNYLMFRKIVKAVYIPPEKQEYNFFKTGVKKMTNSFGKITYVSHKIRAANRKIRHLNDWSEENCKKRMKRANKKLEALRERCAKYGLDLDDYVVKPKENGIAKGPSEEADENETSRKATRSNGKRSDSDEPENTSGIALKTLLEDTIDDESSDDDDYLPSDMFESGSVESDEEDDKSQSDENSDDDASEEDASDDDFDETLETSGTDQAPTPQKPATKTLIRTKESLKTSDRQGKILKINQMDGRVHKKGKQIKTKRNPALQKMIQNTAKSMVKEQSVPLSKAKNFKKNKNKR